MNISPVSFGKTVRVIGSKDTAYDIARLANEKKVSGEERPAQKIAKSIFNDTNIAQAQVVSVTGTRGKENVFIVSGKESLELDKLNDKLADGIILAGDVFKNTEKFSNSCARQMRKHNFDIYGLLISTMADYGISATYNSKGTNIKSINKIL